MKPLNETQRYEIKGILSDRHIAALAEVDASDPGWKARVEERKTKLAIGRLKVEKEVIQLKAIEEQMTSLTIQRQEVEARIAKKMPRHARGRHDACPTPKSLCEAIAEIAAEINDSVMAKDPAGKRVLAANKAYLDGKAALAQCDTREQIEARKIL